MGLFSASKRTRKSKVTPNTFAGTAVNLAPSPQAKPQPENAVTLEDFKDEVTACGLGADWGGARLEQLFSIFDLDGNGWLEPNELKTAASQLRKLLTAIEDVPAKQAAAAKPAEAKLEKWEHPAKGVQAVESAARWTAGEWEKNLAALAKKECGEGEALACHFTNDANAHLIFSAASRGLRASTAGQLDGGLSLDVKMPHEQGWKPYARGAFRHIVGKDLWGEKAGDVLLGGVDEDKINLLIVVKVKRAHLDDPERRVPGRDAIVILPRREPELTSADGHHWLPKEQVLKVFRLAGDDKAREGMSSTAKHCMHSR